MTAPSGVKTGGYISWERLILELRKTGEIKPKEIVTKIEVVESGIHYEIATCDGFNVQPDQGQPGFDAVGWLFHRKP